MLAPTARAQSVQSGAWSFLSAPTLDPPAVFVTADRGASAAPDPQAGGAGEPTQAPGYIFLAPIKNFGERVGFTGKPGPEILEADGNEIWDHPLGGPIKVGNTTYEMVAMNFHAATYMGQPVLVWWEGYITPQGFGNGFWAILNQRYQTVAKIYAPKGFELDFHEIQLTPQGTVFIIANRTVGLNLHCCGGPAKGQLYDQVIFELELKTGRVIWQWDPLQHVRLRESYVTPPATSPWDPYHLNSLTFSPSGDPIISARNTSAAYWVSRKTGQIFAILGGKRSTFKLGAGAHFAWQHAVEQQGDQVTVFDDEAAPVEGKQSRGLLLRLNWAHHTATVLQEFLLPQPALAGSQGNVQRLPNGNFFVGWGQLPYFSEYTSTGNLLYLGRLPGPDESYRAFRFPWIGEPLSAPSLTVQRAGGGADLYASWNGATQVAAWQPLAGSRPSSLAAVAAPVARQGFETLIAAGNSGPYYAVHALDSAGHVLGSSPVISSQPPPAHKTAAAHSKRG
jgi:hypothetical protein